VHREEAPALHRPGHAVKAQPAVALQQREVGRRVRRMVDAVHAAFLSVVVDVAAAVAPGRCLQRGVE
jgi:hypothetical protein